MPFDPPDEATCIIVSCLGDLRFRLVSFSLLHTCFSILSRTYTPPAIPPASNDFRMDAMGGKFDVSGGPTAAVSAIVRCLVSETRMLLDEMRWDLQPFHSEISMEGDCSVKSQANRIHPKEVSTRPPRGTVQADTHVRCKHAVRWTRRVDREQDRSTTSEITMEGSIGGRWYPSHLRCGTHERCKRVEDQRRATCGMTMCLKTKVKV